MKGYQQDQEHLHLGYGLNFLVAKTLNAGVQSVECCLLLFESQGQLDKNRKNRTLLNNL